MVQRKEVNNKKEEKEFDVFTPSTRSLICFRYDSIFLGLFFKRNDYDAILALSPREDNIRRSLLKFALEHVVIRRSAYLNSFDKTLSKPRASIYRSAHPSFINRNENYEC